MQSEKWAQQWKSNGQTHWWLDGWTDGMARDRLDLTIWLGPYTRRQKTAHAALWWCLLDHDLHHYHRSRTNRTQGGTQRHCSMILNLSHPHPTHSYSHTPMRDCLCVKKEGNLAVCLRQEKSLLRASMCERTWLWSYPFSVYYKRLKKHAESKRHKVKRSFFFLYNFAPFILSIFFSLDGQNIN